LSPLIAVSEDPLFLSLYLETWKKLCSAVVHMNTKPCGPKLSILASKLAADFPKDSPKNFFAIYQMGRKRQENSAASESHRKKNKTRCGIHPSET